MLIRVVLCYMLRFRHVLTAAHCVCTLVGQYPNTAYPCRTTKDSDQILVDNNEIYVYGGDRSINAMSKNPDDFLWPIDKGHVMDETSIDSKKTSFDEYDIGILKIPDTFRTFFEDKVLKDKAKLNIAQIVPVCLAALDTDTKSKKFKMAGWGQDYDEIPRRESSTEHRDPIISSCMTSEASPRLRKYRNCNMELLKKSGPDGEYWDCEKRDLPPSYKGKYERCKDYFTLASDGNDPVTKKKLKERLDRVQKMYIVDDKWRYIDICYNPTLFSKYGWCNITHTKGADQYAWGMCSPSCRTEILKVN